MIPKSWQSPAQDILDGLRNGNGYVVQGDLIDKLVFLACAGDECATMGQTLEVKPGTDVTVRVALRDPEGTNHSPYSFNNPSLLQIGIEQPLNQPKLVRVDLIKGVVTRHIEPNDPEYRNPLAPQTTMIAKSWTESDRWGHGPWKRMSYELGNVQSNMYVRIRGTNIPAGTPNEQDENGNPLADNLSDHILCSAPACPPHVNGILDADVEAWADVWFYANPIFIKLRGTGPRDHLDPDARSRLRT